MKLTAKPKTRTVLIGIAIVMPILVGAFLDWLLSNRFPICLFIGAAFSICELAERLFNRSGTFLARKSKPGMPHEPVEEESDHAFK